MSINFSIVNYDNLPLNSSRVDMETSQYYYYYLKFRKVTKYRES